MTNTSNSAPGDNTAKKNPHQISSQRLCASARANKIFTHLCLCVLAPWREQSQLKKVFKNISSSTRQTPPQKRHKRCKATETPTLQQQQKPDRQLKGRHGKKIQAIIFSLLLLLQATSAKPAFGEETIYTIDIPAQNVAQALTELSVQTDIQVLFPYDIAQSKTGNPVKGNYPIQQALDQLLQNTGLSGGLSNKGVLMISEVKSEENEHKRKETMNSRKNILAAVIGFLVGAGGAHDVLAQSGNDGAVQKKVALEEILVTATKKGRAENVQDVPISITAMNESQLDAIHFESIHDIGYKFPNATLKESELVPGQAQFFIRGVGVNHTAKTMDPSVGVTINGMPLAVNAGMTMDSFDLESVEVLRGPQGTLFGRNVTGGVVVLRTKRPTGEFGFEAQGVVGSYDRRDIAFGIENALVEDKLAGRLAVMYKDHDGYYKNANGGNRIGESKTKIIRPTLVFTPSDTLDITLFTEYGKLDAGMPPVRNLLDPGTDYSQFIYTPPSDDLRELDQDLSGPNTNEWWHAISEVNWDVGPGQLTSVTGYREMEMVTTIDIDGSPSFGVVHYIPSFYEQDQFNQEIRYAVDIGDRFNLTTGLYYFDQSYQDHWGVDVFGGLNLRHSFNNHDTYGLFAQGEVALAEEWVLTLGGRYSKESKDIRVATAAGGGCELDPSDPLKRTNCNYDFEDSESWKNFSPKVGLQWVINDTSQAYASWSKGFKSGGYNNEGDEPAAVGPYDEETVEAWEIGLKSDLLDGKLRMNLAAFFNDYTDMQRFVFSTLPGFDGEPPKAISAIKNAGSAEVMGFEAELTYLATEHLTLSGNLGLMSNDIKEFNGLDVDGDSVPDPELAKETELVEIPEVTYNLAFAYEIPLSVGDLSIRGDYAYTGKRPGNNDNTLFLDPRRSLNLSTTFTTNDGHYRISVFGKNVLDDVSLESGSSGSFITTGNPNKPRTWGVELKYTF